MDTRGLILFALKVAIVGTVFGYGLKAATSDLLQLARPPGLRVRSILAMMVAMPVIVIALVELLDLVRRPRLPAGRCLLYWGF